jgi:hypothetical protein
MDDILFDEMKKSIRSLQARAEHFLDHSNENIAKSARQIVQRIDEINDSVADIEKARA